MDEKTVFDILRNHFEMKGLVHQQTESFNHFITKGIQEVIDEEPEVIIQRKKDQQQIISFGHIYIPPPKITESNGKTRRLYPAEARRRNMTYCSPIYCDIKESIVNQDGKNEETFHTRIPIGKIPIMVRSAGCNLKRKTNLQRIKLGECDMDPGGYFIIKGNERVLVAQLRKAYNQVFVSKNKEGEKNMYTADIRSMSEETGHSVLIEAYFASNNRNITFSLPYIKENIPAGIVFKALGYTDEKDIRNLIGLEGVQVEKYLKHIIRDSYFIKTKDEALAYLGKHAIHTIPPEKHKAYAWQVVESELFPHMGVTASVKEKAIYMGYIINKLLATRIGMRSEDDRDNQRIKRIETAGTLCRDLFRTLFKRYTNSLSQYLTKKKQFTDIMTVISKNNSITNGLLYSFSTGNWGVKKNSYIRSGVSQVLSRMTYGATLSHLRRVIISNGKDGKNSKIRQIHSSQFGYICPSECFDPETQILMWDGTVKRAADVVVGDTLIDDYGQPVKVKSTCSGKKNMYDIIPVKKNFTKHRVTDNHILTLKIRKHKDICKTSKNRPKKWFVEYFNRETLKFQSKYFITREEAQQFVDNMSDDNTVDLTIEQYEKLNKTAKDRLVIFKSPGIGWKKQDVLLDPYILGMWLGDGLSTGYGFALNYKTDNELLEYWNKWARENDATVNKGSRYSYSINKLKGFLEQYNLVKNKHIPNEYIVNDRQTRLKVLAGLIDTDGHVRANGREIRIVQGPANYRIIDNAHMLAMSLGFSCGVKEGKSQWTDEKTNEKKYSTYKELTVTGKGIEEIPTLLPRKKLNPPNNTTQLKRCESFMGSKFVLEEKGVGPYVGWQLEDKRGRFTLSTGEIVHNTPEGKTAGIVLNFSLLTSVTTRIPTVQVKETIEGVDSLITIDDVKELEDIKMACKVFLNGILMGLTDTPGYFVEKVKELRKKKLLESDVSIVYDTIDEEVRVYSDEGRLTRPLFDVEKNKLLVQKRDGTKWNELVKKGKIKYIDASEIEACVVAMFPGVLDKGEYDNDLCEIHPSMMLGVMASIIPFPDHNQSPRNCYQSSMGKQALGIYALSYKQRTDTVSFVLDYPQRPIVSTKAADFMGFNDMPSGVNAIVAILAYTGLTL